MLKTKIVSLLFLVLFSVACDRFCHVAAPQSSKAISVERGRYLSIIGGCHDCHTPGWETSTLKTPEKNWLIGSNIGYQGPWGTTYPSNLRRTVGQMDEEAWVQLAHGIHTLPPMPWWILNTMTEEDLRSFHRFIKKLGVRGGDAPAALPPGQMPKPPIVSFVPAGK